MWTPQGPEGRSKGPAQNTDLNFMETTRDVTLGWENESDFYCTKALENVKSAHKGICKKCEGMSWAHADGIDYCGCEIKNWSAGTC